MEILEGVGEAQWEKEVDAKALRVFLKTIDFLGGPRNLFAYRNLTWLPSLMAASYVIVLSEEHFWTAGEIAQALGISKNTVQNILRADPEAVKGKLFKTLSAEEMDETGKTHTAGGLAKLAYQEIQEGRDSIEFLRAFFGAYQESVCRITWPVEVLARIEGADFPLEREEVERRLGDLVINDKPLSQVLDKFSYPISSPAQLLHEIAQATRES